MCKKIIDTKQINIHKVASWYSYALGDLSLNLLFVCEVNDLEEQFRLFITIKSIPARKINLCSRVFCVWIIGRYG